MIVRLYSVLDKAVGAYSNPIVAQNEIMLKRSLRDLFLAEAVRREEERHQFYRYADMHDVYVVGTFDTDAGTILAASAPEFVCHMAEFKA